MKKDSIFVSVEPNRNKTMEKVNIEALFARQMEVSPEIRETFMNLKKVITESVECGNFRIDIQHNPARIRSTNADIRKESITARKCFLCPQQLKENQIAEKWDDRYFITVNPYPIFDRHFTVIACEHTPQTVMCRIGDMIELGKSYIGYTIFYNGPFSGASAPDHMHFQLIPSGIIPIEKDAGNPALLEEAGSGNLYTLKKYFRSVLLIREKDPKLLEKQCYKVLEKLSTREGETEPRVNIICWNSGSGQNMAIFPRSEHRPSEFFLEEPDRIMFSPGAVDMGGTVIAPRYNDFIRYRSSALLEKLFRQVSDDNLNIF